MITEDYVSFETAKLLQEKGFDRECHFSKYCIETKHEEGGECWEDFIDNLTK